MIGSYFGFRLINIFLSFSIKNWFGLSLRQIVPSFITRLLPNKNDQFHDGSQEESCDVCQSNATTAPSLPKTVKIAKPPKKQNKIKPKCRVPIAFVQIDDQNIEGMEKGPHPGPHVERNVIDIIQLDDQQIQYYKQKLKIGPTTQVGVKNGGVNQGQDQISRKQIFIPPKEQKKAPKYIYEYPPYPLGPTDTWPPKYPNSWRSFKQEMRQCRKLD